MYHHKLKLLIIFIDRQRASQHKTKWRKHVIRWYNSIVIKNVDYKSCIIIPTRIYRYIHTYTNSYKYTKRILINQDVNCIYRWKSKIKSIFLNFHLFMFWFVWNKHVLFEIMKKSYFTLSSSDYLEFCI